MNHTVQPSDCPIPDTMERILSTLSQARPMANVVRLYAMSQAENCRNGKATMEIGMARERDLLAVLKMEMGDDVKVDLDNNLTADCIVADRPISVKHVSGAPGKGPVKAKWTSDTAQATAYVDKMLSLKPEHYTDIVIAYIDMPKEAQALKKAPKKPKEPKSPKITFIGLAADAVLEGVRLLGREAFISRTGTNNRGVEYSPKLLKHLFTAPAFRLERSNVTLAGGLDPIQRRIALLKALHEQEAASVAGGDAAAV